MTKVTKGFLLAICMLFPTICIGHPITEESKLSEALKPFWQHYALEYHSTEDTAVFIEAQCWDDEVHYCVMVYAEPLPSGWDSYLSVFKPNAKEPINSLRWGRHDRLLGYNVIAGELFVTIVDTNLLDSSQAQRVTLYQWFNDQFVELSTAESKISREE